MGVSMEIKQSISSQRGNILSTLQRLSYERLQNTRAIESIDAQMKVLEGALEANTILGKENDTIEIIADAQKAKATKELKE